MNTASHLAYENDDFIDSGGLRQLPIFGGELRVYSHLIDLNRLGQDLQL